MTVQSPAPDIDFRNMLLDILVAAAGHWAKGENVDLAAMTAVRHQAILINHRSYMREIPAYAQIAHERGLADETIDNVGVIANELMFPTDLFKSYDPNSLLTADFSAMNRWIRTIFHRPPNIAVDGLQTVADWRARLRDDSVYLSYSSGTSGHLSFVPRDKLAWTALVRNGSYASHPDWSGERGDYDCLILGPRGSGMGMQAVATGLARAAVRAHYLFDVELNADVLLAMHISREGQRFRAATTAGRDEAIARCIRFLRESRDLDRRVLVFGPPYEVAVLCARIVAENESICLPGNSIVTTGGGWKTAAPIAREELVDNVQTALGIRRDRVIDVYSTTECNCACLGCGAGRYHIPPLIEPLVVDDLMIPIPGHDVFGTIGFLDPFAVSYPGFLITGDEGRLVYGRCDCGLDGWAILGEVRRRPNQEVKGCAGVLASALT